MISNQLLPLQIVVVRFHSSRALHFFFSELQDGVSLFDVAVCEAKGSFQTSFHYKSEA